MNLRVRTLNRISSVLNLFTVLSIAYCLYHYIKHPSPNGHTILALVLLLIPQMLLDIYYYQKVVSKSLIVYIPTSQKIYVRNKKELIYIGVPDENYTIKEVDTILQQKEGKYQKEIKEALSLTGEDRVVALIKLIIWGWQQEALKRVVK